MRPATGIAIARRSVWPWTSYHWPSSSPGRRASWVLRPPWSSPTNNSLPSRRLAGRGAFALDDQIETVRTLDVAADRHARRQRLDIALDQLGRRARRADRAIQAGADQPLQAQRRAVDRDRRFRHGQPLRGTGQRHRQIEPRAQLQSLQRPRHHAARSPPQRQGDARAGRDRSPPAACSTRSAASRAWSLATSGTLQHASQPVARADRGRQLDHGRSGASARCATRSLAAMRRPLSAPSAIGAMACARAFFHASRSAAWERPR